VTLRTRDRLSSRDYRIPLGEPCRHETRKLSNALVLYSPNNSSQCRNHRCNDYRISSFHLPVSLAPKTSSVLVTPRRTRSKTGPRTAPRRQAAKGRWHQVTRVQLRRSHLLERRPSLVTRAIVTHVSSSSRVRVSSLILRVMTLKNLLKQEVVGTPPAPRTVRACAKFSGPCSSRFPLLGRFVFP
jgi:hypothetical protein